MTEEKNKAKKNEADEIWDEIKNKSIDVYAMVQPLDQHVEKMTIPGNVLYLRPKSPAIISSLGTVLGEDYVVETSSNGYILVSRATKLPSPEEEFVTFQRNGKVEKLAKKKYLGK
jgi:hypothetical protein